MIGRTLDADRTELIVSRQSDLRFQDKTQQNKQNSPAGVNCHKIKLIFEIIEF